MGGGITHFHIFPILPDPEVRMSEIFFKSHEENLVFLCCFAFNFDDDGDFSIDDDDATDRCPFQFLITVSFWILPSFFWKYSALSQDSRRDEDQGDPLHLLQEQGDPLDLLQNPGDPLHLLQDQEYPLHLLQEQGDPLKLVGLESSQGNPNERITGTNLSKKLLFIYGKGTNKKSRSFYY